MKLYLGICLGLCWLLVGCAGEIPAPVNAAPTNPPIQILPGGSSILVPATLSPAEKTEIPERSLVQLTLNNQSDWNVCYVYISAPNEDTWGEDWLDSEEIIKFNQTRVFEIQPGIYDVRAENCDYIGLTEQYEIDVFYSTSWVVNNPSIMEIDSFQEQGAWKTIGSGTQSSIVDNAMILTAGQPGGLVIATAGKKFDNLVVTVEATPLASGGATTAGYGLMCRVQPNGDGYLFLIREDGTYAIFRNDHNERVPMVDWKSSAEILTGAQLNVVEAHCDGESLGLRINGLTVEKITDTILKDGDIGLAVLPGETGNARVQFDNLVVIEP